MFNGMRSRISLGANVLYRICTMPLEAAVDTGLFGALPHCRYAVIPFPTADSQ